MREKNSERESERERLRETSCGRSTVRYGRVLTIEAQTQVKSSQLNLT